MTTQQLLVKLFHLKASQVVNDKPTEIDKETRILRLRLINEELCELAEAFGYEPVDDSFVWHDTPFDLVEVADALGDLLYVVLGTAVSCGIDLEPIFNEINRSNMSKFIDGHRRADGKWIKGPSYSPANLKPIIDAQLEK